MSPQVLQGGGSGVGGATVQLVLDQETGQTFSQPHDFVHVHGQVQNPESVSRSNN